MTTLRHRFRKGEPHPDRDLFRLEKRRPPGVKSGVYIEVIICPACELLYLATERGQTCTHCDQKPEVFIVKYFHQLTDVEFQELMEKKITWAQVAVLHPQPEWCQYPNALDDPMGCWSLTDRTVKEEDSCRGCDCYRPACTLEFAAGAEGTNQAAFEFEEGGN